MDGPSSALFARVFHHPTLAVVVRLRTGGTSGVTFEAIHINSRRLELIRVSGRYELRAEPGQLALPLLSLAPDAFRDSLSRPSRAAGHTVSTQFPSERALQVHPGVDKCHQYQGRISQILAHHRPDILLWPCGLAANLRSLHQPS
jgi:hypothetical protein